MKVLMISTNRESLPDPVAPLGAAYVANALKEAGHEVKFLDLQFAIDLPVAVKDMVRTFKPKMVGLSIRNIDNVSFPQSVSYIPELVGIVKLLKALGVRLIVAGGSGFTMMPVEIMQALDINLGIIGEGEEAMPEIVRRVEYGHAINNMPGLIYRVKGEFIVNPPKHIEDLDLVEPDRMLLENHLYMSEGGAGNIQTKRGCSFNCVYCTYPLVEGRKVRVRSAAKAAAEFERAVKEFGLKHLFIVDSVFNFPIEHAKEFCREVIGRNIDAGWSCYLNPKSVDEELFELMAKAGCKGVEFGTDSGCDEVLAELKKSFKVADIIQASDLCRQAGLPFCHSLMLGAPGETAETVTRTLDLMTELRPNAIIAMLGIRVFPGTAIAKRAVADGVVGEGAVGLKPVFYFSPKLDMNAVSEILGRYGREHANFIMPGIQLRMNEKIRQKLRSYGFTGPLWEYLRG
ncbi:MAG TPA: lipid biosynthesis B12-binding/radical SAM protein [Nitrospirota bacterium]|jgi:radical SAM superfamily enzyme YgiQ (UPF0313 family)